MRYCKYNIRFDLGDRWNDGYGRMISYHMTATHSIEEISKAYKRVTEKLGYDFAKEVGVNYMSDWVIPSQYTKELEKLGVLNPRDINESGEYEVGCPEDDFLQIFEDLIKTELPDFYWEERDLEEDRLSILDGALYGWM